MFYERKIWNMKFEKKVTSEGWKHFACQVGYTGSRYLIKFEYND